MADLTRARRSGGILLLDYCLTTRNETALEIHEHVSSQPLVTGWLDLPVARTASYFTVVCHSLRLLGTEQGTSLGSLV